MSAQGGSTPSRLNVEHRSTMLLALLTPPSLVSQHITSQLFFDPNLQYYLHRDSPYQHE
jgi:hypothetical protein